MGSTALASETADLKMMVGSGGKKDYLVVARKGNMVFGIKPLVAAPGRLQGVPGTTYFVARLRVAPAGSLFDEEEEGTVVKFKQKFSKPSDAWPEISWSKVADSRASTIFSMFTKGSLGEGAELEQALLDAIADKKIGKKLAGKLEALIGKEFMVITPRKLADYTDAAFTQPVQNAMKAHAQAKETQKALFAALEDNFGVEQEVLKSVYKALGKNDPDQVEDAEPDDEAEDEAPGEGDEDPDEI